MYNSMSALPSIPYNILTYLAQEEQILWKILYYDGYDALSQPDLTMTQKLDMLWKEGPQEPYNVFFTNIIDDAIPTSKTILKIFNYYIHADSLYVAPTVYAFEILYGPKMSLVEYNGKPVSRADLMVNRLMTLLNGAYVGGVGKLTFLDDMSRYDLGRSIIGNSKTFTGYQLFLSVLVGDAGVEVDGCGES